MELCQSLQFLDFSKADALAELKALVAEAPINISPSARLVFDLANLARIKPGFVDRLIHGAAHVEGQTFVTFEKAAQKLPQTLVLSPTPGDGRD